LKGIIDQDAALEKKNLHRKPRIGWLPLSRIEHLAVHASERTVRSIGYRRRTVLNRVSGVLFRGATIRHYERFGASCVTAVCGSNS
jgi:hypothetical protein